MDYSDPICLIRIQEGTNGNMGNKLTDHIGYTSVSF